MFDFNSIRKAATTAWQGEAGRIVKKVGMDVAQQKISQSKYGEYVDIAQREYQNVLKKAGMQLPFAPSTGGNVPSFNINNINSSLMLGLSTRVNNAVDVKANPFNAMEFDDLPTSVPGGILRYPMKGSDDIGPYMKIQGFEYVYDDKNVLGNKAVSSHEKVKRTACIILPLPASLSQDTSIGWTDYNSVFAKLVSSFKQTGMDLSVDTLKQIGGSLQERLNKNPDAWDDATKIAGLAGATAMVSGGGMVTSALGEGFDFIRMQGGLSVNRMTQAAYSGVDIKTHEFSYTMIPRNQRESTEIKKIVEMLQYCSMGEMTEGWGGLLTNFPSVWNISFHAADGRVINGMLEIPDSVMTTVGVVYGGAGASFKVLRGVSGTGHDSYMTTLTLQFKESQNMVRDDLSYIRQGGSLFKDIHPETSPASFDTTSFAKSVAEGANVIMTKAEKAAMTSADAATSASPNVDKSQPKTPTSTGGQAEKLKQLQPANVRKLQTGYTTMDLNGKRIKVHYTDTTHSAEVWNKLSPQQRMKILNNAAVKKEDVVLKTPSTKFKQTRIENFDAQSNTAEFAYGVNIKRTWGDVDYE